MRRAYLSFALVLLSAAIAGPAASLPFQCPDAHQSAWCCLVPCALVIARAPSVWWTAVFAILAGVYFQIDQTQWLGNEWGYEFLVGSQASLIAALASFWPIAWVAARVVHHEMKWPMVVVLPLAWLALEQSPAVVGAGLFGPGGAYSVNTLAQTQVDNPWLSQFADVLGAGGITLVLGSANGALVDLVLRLLEARRPLAPPQFQRFPLGVAVAPCLFASVWLYGQWRIATTPTHRMIQVAVAPNVLGALDRAASRLTKRIRWKETAERPRLWIFSESSSGETWTEEVANDRGPSPNSSQPPQDDKTDIAAQKRLQAAASTLGGAIVCGGRRTEMVEGVAKRFNSGMAFDASGRCVGYRDKRRLVPTREAPLLPSASGSINDQYFDMGEPRGAIAIDGDSSPLYLIVLVCYEITISAATGEALCQSDPDPAATLAIGIGSERSIHPELGTRLMQAHARLRAIEFRLPVVRSVAHGTSAVIDGAGRVLASLDPADHDPDALLLANVPLDGRRSAYRAIGDAGVHLLVSFFLALSVYSLGMGWRGFFFGGWVRKYRAARTDSWWRSGRE